MKELLLGIDIGTSACKVAVFDAGGHALAQANRPYSVYYPHPGWAEQDADEWWAAVREGIREVLLKPSAGTEDIEYGYDDRIPAGYALQPGYQCLKRVALDADEDDVGGTLIILEGRDADRVYG